MPNTFPDFSHLPWNRARRKYRKLYNQGVTPWGDTPWQEAKHMYKDVWQGISAAPTGVPPMPTGTPAPIGVPPTPTGSIDSIPFPDFSDLPWKQARREYKDLWRQPPPGMEVPFTDYGWRQARRGFRDIWRGTGTPEEIEEQWNPTYPELDYPMGADIWNEMMGSLPWLQPQLDALNVMGSKAGFREAVTPHVRDLMRGIGRSGLPSSSYADRNVSQTLGSLWAQNMGNVLAGYQNMASTAAPYMAHYRYPYDQLLQMYGAA